MTMTLATTTTTLASLASTSTASMVSLPASTSLAALTTPWKQPLICANASSLTTFTHTTNPVSKSITDYLVVIASLPPPANPTSCLPSGYQEFGREHYVYSPAVCPSDWTAYSLLASYGTSQAWCCPRNHKPTFLTNPAYPSNTVEAMLACGSTVPATTTSDTDGVPVSTILHVRDPITIQWEYTDLASLSPLPPYLTGCHLGEIATWVPGQTVDSTARFTCPPNSTLPYQSDHADRDLALALGLSIGLGVTGIATAIALCCFCCNRKKRKSRLSKDEVEVARLEGTSNTIVEEHVGNSQTCTQLQDLQPPSTEASETPLGSRPPSYRESEAVVPDVKRAAGPPTYGQHQRDDRLA